MPVPRAARSEPEDEISVDEVVKETKGIFDKVLKDVGKTSATKQLILGTASGWCTGYLAMKVGKVVAVAAGGGILLVQLASHKGYININWDKLCKKADKVADKVEKEATGKGPGFMDKVERFVDRKVNKAEDALRNNKRKVRKWYQSLIGEDSFTFTETHIFIGAYGLALALSMAIHR